MISEKFQCIFIHIPKVAGQSIESFFLNKHNLSWDNRAPLLLKFNPDPQQGPERLAHLKAAEYLDYGYINKYHFDQYFKFSFVRNPWSRLVSEYRYRAHHQTIAFKDFVMHSLPTKSDYTDSYRHIIPQYDFLYNTDGKLLIDFVGRFESLQKDFDDVCSQLGIADSILPHMNASNHFNKNHYTQYYDAETIEIVGQMYAKDIETFRYSFE